MSTITVKELAAPTGYDLKIAAGETVTNVLKFVKTLSDGAHSAKK